MRGVKKAVEKLDDLYLSSRVEMYGEVKPAPVTPITAEAQVGVPHDGLGLLDIVVDHWKSGKIPKHPHQTVAAGSLDDPVICAWAFRNTLGRCHSRWENGDTADEIGRVCYSDSAPLPRSAPRQREGSQALDTRHLW